jgi:molybdopterin-guanine dinucleotide biosynthesis protein A
MKKIDKGAVILCGGRGRRFIPHKGLLKINGKTIIERQISRLKYIFPEIIIVSNNPTLYEYLKVRVIADLILDKGPLGGIYSALKFSSNKYNFIIGSDMPYINLNLIKYMEDKLGLYDIVVPEYNGYLQPLYAFYSKRCLKVIERQFKKNNLKIRDIFPELKVRTITHNEVRKIDHYGYSFINLNTINDYKRVREEVC